MAGTAVTLTSGRMVPLVVGAIGLLGCGACVLVLTYRHNARLDLTPERRYTLSTHARRILASLERDVHITAFVRSEDPRTPVMKDVLWRMGAETPRLTYEFVDLNRSPARAQRYGVDRYGALIVESAGRRRDVSNPSEGLLVGALLAVSRERQRVVYFVSGHGEHSPESSDRKAGYSTAKRTLEEELFEVRELPLVTTSGIPADATAVVVAGPRKDYLNEEIGHLDAYMARGGNALLLLDPESPMSVSRFAARYGVVPLDRVVVDPERRLASGEGVTLLVSGLSPTFLVSGTLEAPPVFSYARPLQVGEGATSSADAFLQTGSASFTIARGASVTQRDPADPVGPLVVGAAVHPTIADGDAGRGSGGRMIVYGDSDFGTNGVIEYLGNKDLLVNSLNWLARDEDLVAARAQQKEVGREQFFVTEAQGAMAFWLAAVVQPALFMAAGIVAFLRRRWA